MMPKEMSSRHKILHALSLRAHPAVYALLLERDTPSLRAVLHFYLTGNAAGWEKDAMEKI